MAAKPHPLYSTNTLQKNFPRRAVSPSAPVSPIYRATLAAWRWIILVHRNRCDLAKPVRMPIFGPCSRRSSSACQPTQPRSRQARSGSTRSSGTVFVFASGVSADQKVLRFLARSKLRRQPAGLFTAARPSLGRIFRIPVFGKNLRVRTALAVRGDNLAGRSKLVQPLLKSGLFYRQFASQFRGYLFMEFPQVVDGH